MPVPASINDLSTTAGSNYPQGTDTPTTGDDTLRALASFIATLRDQLNGTSNTGTIKNATFTGTTAGLRVPLVAYKPTTTSRSSTITVTDDPHLTVSLDVGTFAFQMWLPFWATTTTTQGIRLQFGYTGTTTAPAAYTYSGVVLGSATSTRVANLATLYSTTDISTATDTFNADYLLYSGVITTTSAGTLSLKWAQNSSSANATNIGNGAWLKLTKVS